MAKRFGCKVVGLVNSGWHVERGKQLNKGAGLEDMIEIVQGDYHVGDYDLLSRAVSRLTDDLS